MFSIFSDRRMLASLIMFLLIEGGTAAHVVYGEGTTEGPVKSFIKSQEKFRHLTAHIETQLAIVQNGKTSIREIDTWLARDGNRISLTSNHHISRSNGRRDNKRFQTHHIVEGDKCYWYRTPNTTGRPNATEGCISLEKGASYSTVENGSALDGYFDGSDGKSLAELLELPTATTTVGGKSAIQGEPCREVTAKTPYGEIKLWLAEKRDSLPLRVIYTKKALDRWEGTTLVNATKYSPKWPNVASWTASLTDVVISKIGEAFVATGGTLTMEWKLEDETSIVQEGYYVRSQIDLAPDFSKDKEAFVFALPEGSEIHDELAPDDGTIYAWRNGKVVAGTPDFGRDAPKKREQWRTALSEASVWVLDFGLIVFNGLAAIVLVRMRPGSLAELKGLFRRR